MAELPVGTIRGKSESDRVRNAPEAVYNITVAYHSKLMRRSHDVVNILCQNALRQSATRLGAHCVISLPQMRTTAVRARGLTPLGRRQRDPTALGQCTSCCAAAVQAERLSTMSNCDPAEPSFLSLQEKRATVPTVRERWLARLRPVLMLP